MPARVTKIRHDENTRAKIKAAQIIGRFQAFFFGTTDPLTNRPVDLSSAQVTVGIALLKKMVPDLESVELSGEISMSKVIRSPQVIDNVSEWSNQYVPEQHRTEH